jgi:glycosyltransferase involved in cell wall biosynthesis
MKVIIIGALPESLLNFRGNLIKDIYALGHEIIAMAAPTSEEKIAEIEALGCKFVPLPIKRNGLNPIADITTFLSLINAFRKHQPDIIFAYTIKPVIWGGIAARIFSKGRFFALITGLGFAFQKGNFKRSIINLLVTNLYKLSLKNALKVIFQNPDNLQTFIDNNIVKREFTCRVQGSGVDINHFKKVPLTDNTYPTFLTIARLLGDKGIREFVFAAQTVKKKYPQTRFQILGPEDPSPDGIPLTEVMQWHNNKKIDYLGSTEDVRPFIHQCDIFVLASYHEGMPRTVLEAMSIGRPIITTDVPGCKETVQNGINGFLVRKADAKDLSDKMLWFIENQQQWHEMAEQSYLKVQKQFTVDQINRELIDILQLKRSYDE